GPKFAEYNVGATSVAEYGGYYCWGGTYKNGPAISWNDDHNTGTLELSHTGEDITDTATKLWGSNWRMPTQAELNALINSTNCDVEWIDGTNKKYKDTNITGLLCTGKGAYASNSVFLPAAGYCYDGSVNNQSNYGFYWSSTPDGAYAGDLLFVSDRQSVSHDFRDTGFSVRAVLK
ncbi:MAG: FISUMP domain-containing protein, partial [Bacteroidales bacterium]|nr:FISUMP domain-containing protein [Bacteroidales bacterium]